MFTKPNDSRKSCCCAGSGVTLRNTGSGSRSWNIKYFVIVTISIALWWLIYSHIQVASNWLVFTIGGFPTHSQTGASLQFFIYDTLKILLLLVALIYAIAWIRTSMHIGKVRHYLATKQRWLGYFLASLFGAATPFCSCSSIPLFLGFTSAGIPIGISMSFLITSPLINEIAIILLWGLLGWKFTVTYVVVGLTAGMLGGFLMDRIKADRWLQPFTRETIRHAPSHSTSGDDHITSKASIRQRHNFAREETTMIVKRVWKWVIIGVGIGAVLHGFVPENWFAENFDATEWWTVPAAVLVSVPLYSNVTGIIPILESLLLKGLPLGTTLAFCMGAVVASIPEFIMLRRIMTYKLQGVFVAYLWVMLIVVGWLFNLIGPEIL